MKFNDRDIHVEWHDGILTLENASIRRRIDWRCGMPRTIEFGPPGINLHRADEVFDLALAGFPAPGAPESKTDYHTGAVRVEKLPPRDGDGVKVTVASIETIRRLRLRVAYILYPGLPVIACEAEWQSGVTPMLFWARRHDEEFNRMRGFSDLHTVTDRLRLPDFRITESVEFRMRTDYNDEPVLRHEYDGRSGAGGNILFARDRAGQEFFWLQEAPPSEERRDHETYDFLIGGDGEVASLGSGINPEDIVPDALLHTNRVVMGIAANGGAQALIRRYLAARQPLAGAIGGAITVNPWGCGCFPRLVNTAFLQSEIAAAAALHADSYQIDDGYQTGNGLAEMAVHNRVLDNAYWQWHPQLLPDGLKPLAEQAQSCAIALSLWFAPSANREYRDWRESADFLLNCHRRYGIDCFKLDAVVLSSYLAEANFTRLLETLHEESGGKVTVNLDVTNGLRGGVFKFGEYGSIFLENRYVCHRWPKHLYHPGNTLDNLWNLAHFCRIQSLQIEIPSPDDCREEGYRERNLPLPTAYPVEYWAMVALMASPLLWFAPSRLSAETAARLTEVITVMRRHREQWRGALIAPVGQRPDGQSITGFYADSGYLLVFRELEAPEQAKLALPEFAAAKLLYGTGEAKLAADGTVTLKQPGTAALFRLTSR